MTSYDPLCDEKDQMSTDSEALAPRQPESRGITRSTRQRGMVTALVACTAVILPLAACDSSGNAPSQGVVTRTCRQVTAVLSDGPDPGSDPVGYAEAQILPLRQIRTADSTLKVAITKLASAYSGFFTSDGKSASATSAVTTATARINKLCPGAGAAA
jgi:hypothetical protein